MPTALPVSVQLSDEQLLDLPDAFTGRLLNSVAAGLLLVKASGRIHFANEALCAIVGYEPREIIGKDCTVLGCSACSTARLNAREGEWCDMFHSVGACRRRCRFVHKNGHTVPVEKTANLLTTPDGTVVSVEYVRDISNIVEQESKLTELTYLLDADNGFAGFVGTSPVMRRFYHLLQQAAQGDAPVLLLGPSGCGKELAAAAIHNLGPRRGNPYVAVNCAAFNESVLESELFGHVRGAFTGAVRDREGRFGAANLGTLFLDEIGDMPLAIQVKLLRFLENGSYEAVGDNTSRYADARLVTATHRPLWDMVTRGMFREDFFFRINVFPVEVPALVSHPEDIPRLVEHFLHVVAKRQERPVPRVSPEALDVLLRHNWPGNVRELRNAVEYAATLGGECITPDHLPRLVVHTPRTTLPRVPASPPCCPNGCNVSECTVSRERSLRNDELMEAIRDAGGNVSEAARRLGIHRTTVYARMKKSSPPHM